MKNLICSLYFFVLLPSITYGGLHELGTKPYISHFEYSLLDYSPSTKVSTFKYEGFYDDFFLYGLEISETIIRLKNDIIIEVIYNLIPNETGSSIYMFTLNSIQNSLGLNFVSLGNKTHMSLKDGKLFTLKNKKSDLTFNKERIVYSMSTINRFFTHENEIDKTCLNSNYILIGHPNWLLYSRARIVYNRFGANYLLGGCESSPEYINNNESTERDFKNKYGLFWREIFNQLTEEELFKLKVAQELIRNSNEVKRLKNKYKDKRLVVVAKAITPNEFYIKVTSDFERQNGYIEITLSQMRVDVIKQEIQILNNKAAYTEINDEEFGSRQIF